MSTGAVRRGLDNQSGDDERRSHHTRRPNRLLRGKYLSDARLLRSR
ncbi:MAG: hypothetical protein QM286_08345 [Acidobacteriota bacterium]|nr:hypothetical protein [Acidobacteriota bacterium]